MPKQPSSRPGARRKRNRIPIIIALLAVVAVVMIWRPWEKHRNPRPKRPPTVVRQTPAPAPPPQLPPTPTPIPTLPPVISPPILAPTPAPKTNDTTLNNPPIVAREAEPKPAPSEPPRREPAKIITTPPTNTVVPPSVVPEPPFVEPSILPRSATNALEAQIVLARHGISSGSIDGKSGPQTGAALKAFQAQHALTENGWLDRKTREVLALESPALKVIKVERQDLERLQAVPATWLGKSELDRLDYETLLELLAERTMSHPGLIVRLNPGVDFNHVVAGAEIVVPAVDYPPARRAARARISLSGHWLRAFDDQANLLAHFPCSIARLVEKRPQGELHVTSVIKNPNYTFDPAVFPESEEGRELGRKLIIPPGPNNPVGVAWVGLDRPGYGIHGTPKPEEIGRTESHGCFRLANWNADYFRRIAWIGMPVSIEP